MKKWLLILLSVSFALQTGAREVYNINRNWRFFSNENDNELVVNLPHTWNNDALGGEKDYYRGMGNYQKDIMIPSEWKGRRVFLRGYGANSSSHLLVNSKFVGDHKGGYTAFTYEITDFLEYGRRNFFWIMANNAPRTDLLPIAGDANSYGGLYRDVELIVTGDKVISLRDNSSDGVYIVQEKVNPEKVEAVAIVKVDGSHADNNMIARLEVTNADGMVAASEQQKFKLPAGTPATVRLPFTIEDPTLWNGTENPYMYEVTVRIESGNMAVDSVTISTGFRSVEVDNAGNFKLNGKPYKLKGVVLHQDRAMVGSAVTPYQVKEDFDFVREIGANIVRVAGVSHNPYFYDLCDRAGIMVWSDFPIVGPARRTDRSFINSKGFTGNAFGQAAEIVAQQYNHPSVVMWGLFSDLRFRGEDPAQFVKELNEATKKQDPSRMTVAASNDDGDINNIPDLIVWDHHFGWREGQPSDIKLWQRQMHNKWSDMRSGVSYGAGASIYHQDDSLGRPDYLGNWHPERWQTHLHEVYLKSLAPDSLFWGIFVGNLFDYGAAMRTWGEGNGINDCGLVTFDRKYRKDAFYLYKANWNAGDPFVYIAERRWNRRSARKQQIKVYTNLPEVTLFVNGEAKGVAQPVGGMALWNDILLEEGENVIEVRGGDEYDRAQIGIYNSGSKYNIR